MADFKSLVEQKLEPVGVSGKDIIYLCPECNDTSGHLYINYDKSYWHCFRCDIGGKRLESLLKLLNIDVEFDYVKLYSEHDKELDEILSSKYNDKNTTPSKILDYSTDLDVLTNYYLQHTTYLSQSAIEYLLNRGLSYEIIQRLCIREGINRYGELINYKDINHLGRDYSGRILVPSLRRDGRISFYVARDYIGDKVAKYLNCNSDLAAASEDVWNLDIVDTDSVVICEGVFTAIAVNEALGKNIAVATYGKSIAEHSSKEDLVRVTSQGEKLIKRGFKNYIVFYDKDAKESAIKTCRYLHDRGCTVRLVRIPKDMYGPKADAADMTPEEVRELIKDSVIYDRLIDMEL